MAAGEKGKGKRTRSRISKRLREGKELSEKSTESGSASLVHVKKRKLIDKKEKHKTEEEIREQVLVAPKKDNMSDSESKSDSAEATSKYVPPFSRVGRRERIGKSSPQRSTRSRGCKKDCTSVGGIYKDKEVEETSQQVERKATDADGEGKEAKHEHDSTVGQPAVPDMKKDEGTTSIILVSFQNNVKNNVNNNYNELLKSNGVDKMQSCVEMKKDQELQENAVPDLDAEKQNSVVEVLRNNNEHEEEICNDVRDCLLCVLELVDVEISVANEAGKACREMQKDVLHGLASVPKEVDGSALLSHITDVQIKCEGSTVLGETKCCAKKFPESPENKGSAISEDEREEVPSVDDALQLNTSVPLQTGNCHHVAVPTGTCLSSTPIIPQMIYDDAPSGYSNEDTELSKAPINPLEISLEHLDEDVSEGPFPLANVSDFLESSKETEISEVSILMEELDSSKLQSDCNRSETGARQIEDKVVLEPQTLTNPLPTQSISDSNLQTSVTKCRRKRRYSLGIEDITKELDICINSLGKSDAVEMKRKSSPKGESPLKQGAGVMNNEELTEIPRPKELIGSPKIDIACQVNTLPAELLHKSTEITESFSEEDIDSFLKAEIMKKQDNKELSQQEDMEIEYYMECTDSQLGDMELESSETSDSNDQKFSGLSASCGSSTNTEGNRKTKADHHTNTSTASHEAMMQSRIEVVDGAEKIQKLMDGLSSLKHYVMSAWKEYKKVKKLT